MKKKLTAKQALDDYDFRFAVQAKLRCSMNTIVAALRGKPSRIRVLRERVLAELGAAGVDLATVRALVSGKRCPRCGLREPHVCLDVRASDHTRSGLPTGGRAMLEPPKRH